jgi:NTE family protein
MPGELAVVLSGGGAKGAFQVGVLEELIVNRGVRVDIAVGTSTGAIQALAVAQDDIPKLVAFWSALRRNSDIYVKKPLGPAGAIFGADSLYEAKGLRRLLKQAADEPRLRATGKKLRLGVVNLGTGAFRTIDETVPGIHNWVYASCAMPVFFEPLTTRAANGTEEQWVDGGVRDVTPLDSALELNPRGVLVIRAAPLPGPGAVRTYPDLVQIGLRAVGILQSEVERNDLGTATLINDLIAAREAQSRALRRIGVPGPDALQVLRPLDLQLARYRFAPIRVIEPEREYSGTLEFDPVKIQAAMAAGRAAVEQHWESIEPLLS